MAEGLVSSVGVACPPFTKGPYTWDQNLSITGTLTAANMTVTGSLTFGDANVDVLSVTGYETITLTAPTTSPNALYSLVTASANWTGSLTSVRATVNSSATGAVGNCYGGRFESNFTQTPSSSGHTTGLYCQVTTAQAGNNPTSVFSIVKSGAAGGATTPYIFIQDSSTTKSTILFDVGGVIGGGAVGTGSGALYYNNTLKMKVNSDTRYMPLSKTEGTYTTELTNPTAATNAIYPLITAGSNWSGSLAAVRARITSTATGAVGNARAIMGVLTMTASPSSQGHTAAGYFEVTAGTTGKNATSIVSLTLAQADGGASTPFIFFDNTSTTKTNCLFTAGGGGGGNVGSGSTDNTKLFSTGWTGSTVVGNMTCAIAVNINGTRYWIPVATATT